MIIQCVALRLCMMVESFYLQIRNIFLHISLRDLSCHKTKKILFLQQISLKLWSVVFLWLQTNPGLEYISVVCHNIIAYLTLSLSATHIFMVKKWGWLFQINVFHQNFPSRFKIFRFPCQFDIVHTLIGIVLLLGWQIYIPNLKKTFTQTCFNKMSQIAFSITVLPQDDRTDFAQEERLGLPCWTMILAICVLVDESKCLDTPIWEFSTILEHLPLWPGYKQILRQLLLLRTLAVWRWCPWLLLL